MTYKQAIEKLNDIRCRVKETSIEEQALVMAIEALKRAGIYGDIIYREDALMCLTGEYPADFKHDELIAKFIRRIRKLPPAQPGQRWIPCSEQLPRQGQEVICQCRANMIKVLKLDAYGDWYQDAEHCYMGGFVIAWMPLPELYKEGSEER